MRLIEKNIWSLFVLSAVVGLFSSCDKDMSYPVYLQVDSALVTTNYPTQGTASSYVSDVWVTVNGKNMGTYEIPAIIPVIASGPANVQLEAGIKMNGVAVKRPYYPFYTADVRQMQLESKKTYTLTPSFTYEPRTIFEFKEDFEDAGIKFSAVEGSASLSKTSDPSLIFSYPKEVNHYSGLIALRPDETFFEVQTSYSFPKKETYCFMEMNYRITHNIEVGLYYHYNGRTIQYPICGIYGSTVRGNAEWKKIYINLTEALNSSSYISHFEIYVKGVKNVGDSATYLFDNIKVLYI